MTSPPLPARQVGAGTRMAVVLLAGAAVLLLVLKAVSALVDVPASGILYGYVVHTVTQAPPWLGGAAKLVGEAGIVLLGVAYCLVLWRTVRRADAGTGRTVLAGAAVVLAYASSEATKLVLTQPRPCASSALATLAECPADWSLPSNHATIAGALAVAVLLTAPRWGLLALPVALAVAAARVAVGVHYPHDVLTGLLHGAVVVALVDIALGGTAQRLGERAVRRRPQRRGLCRTSS